MGHQLGRCCCKDSRGSHFRGQGRAKGGLGLRSSFAADLLCASWGKLFSCLGHHKAMGPEDSQGQPDSEPCNPFMASEENLSSLRWGGGEARQLAYAGLELVLGGGVGSGKTEEVSHPRAWPDRSTFWALLEGQALTHDNRNAKCPSLPGQLHHALKAL